MRKPNSADVAARAAAAAAALAGGTATGTATTTRRGSRDSGDLAAAGDTGSLTSVGDVGTGATPAPHPAAAAGSGKANPPGRSNSGLGGNGHGGIGVYAKGTTDGDYHEPDADDDDLERADGHRDLGADDAHPGALVASSDSEAAYCPSWTCGGDVVLWLNIALGEFGYQAFSNVTASKSITDPIQWLANDYYQSHQGLRDGLAYIITILAYADAALSVLTSSNVKATRQNLVKGFQENIVAIRAIGKNPDDKRSAGLAKGAFVTNLAFIGIAHFAGSMAPITGMTMEGNYSPEVTRGLGWTMFAGQELLYHLLNGRKIFAASTAIANWGHTKPKDRVFKNLFKTPQGIKLVITSLIGAINRGWGFYGLADDTANNVLTVMKDDPFYSKTIYKWGSAVSAFYQNLVTMSLKDYEQTFYPEKAGDTFVVSKKTEVFLKTLAVMVSILRALNNPSLYTGEIEKPEVNYHGDDFAKALTGFILGLYPTAQYTKYIYSECVENWPWAVKQPATAAAASTESPLHDRAADTDARLLGAVGITAARPKADRWDVTWEETEGSSQGMTCSKLFC